ncbi:growth-regulating factor 6-like [Phragmites australis]|uniref:growth-regulating factor 6-like n=1 Tax=Phragmites australis TaxID=29695 RepID=UPI002D767CC4|nr:growth-regulating factor 6-like [Phragmites australis]
MDLGGVVMAAVDPGGASELGLLGGGSRLLKHGRGNAAAGSDEHGWSRAKQARVVAAGDVSEAAKAAAAPFLLGSCSPGHGGEHMLSFSSAASSCPSSAAAAAGAAADGAMPLYYGTPASCSGLSSVSLSTSMPGAMARVRGPFTPSQWIELEHQALIYKYLAANSPIPHSLLIPIRRSLASSPYSPAYLGTSTLGWGSFQLGYSGSADLEPGRCRRTDGKKWRCSRDAVADQKYCERHMNRGRHRSRKHVEGQPGHAAKAMSAAVAAAAASAATQPGTLADSGAGAAAAGLIVNQHQQPVKSYAAGASDPCSLQYNRELVNKQNESENIQDSDNLSMLTSMNTRDTGNLFPLSKQNNPFEVISSRPDFGLVSSDSLKSSPHNSLENVNFLTSQSLNEHQSSASLQHFVDWPRTPAQGGLAWPDAEDMQAQRTQLSVSAPMAASELSSASTSPIHEKLMLSPLKLSREYSPFGLSIAANRDEVSQVEAYWTQMFRDSSIGGPLGEVLTKNGNTESRNCLLAPLNLLTDCWDSSPGMESSPVGVLQKTTFGSVSSSTGSSPRMENHNAYDGISILRDDLGSIVVSHPSIRLL